MKKLKTYYKQNKKDTIFISILLLLFIVLSVLVLTETTISLDALVHTYILKIRNNPLTSILNIITNLASATFLLALSSILFIILKNKKTALYIFMNLTCAFLLNESIKGIITRTRPIGINLVEETGFSFPSGHTMVGFAFYGLITYLLYKKASKKNTKIILIISFILLSLLIGFSRIYLGVHYLTDIIGAFLLASLYLKIFIKLILTEKK